MLVEEASVLELNRGGQNSILDRAKALAQAVRVYLFERQKVKW